MPNQQYSYDQRAFFEYHLIPFKKEAFAAGTAQIMPYYGIPMDQTTENVGFAFNKEIITGFLRDKYGFDGVVCTDWSLLTDKGMMGRVFLPATGWGVENLSLEEADFAILRLEAPFYPIGEGFAQMFKHGDLDFKGEEKARILSILEKVPTIVDIKLTRPAVIPEIAEKCVGLIGNFSANDKVVLDLIFGKYKPTGKLPFELPSSMEAVESQMKDVPYDSKDPLYPFGYGLSY